jgi:hypothetical protein
LGPLAFLTRKLRDVNIDKFMTMSNWRGMHCPVDQAEFAKSAFAISGLDIRYQPGRNVEIGH